MRRKPWKELLLLISTLLGGPGAFAQYNPPSTPAPYNPIALAEVTGASRAAVQAGQSNYQTLSQNPYLGGVPVGRLSATPVPLSLDDAVAREIARLIAGGETQDKAIELVDATDKSRAAFVRQYLGLKWPEPHLYHATFNTEMGDPCTARMLVECLQLFQSTRDCSQ
jgi:hypothetical protein